MRVGCVEKNKVMRWWGGGYCGKCLVEVFVRRCSLEENWFGRLGRVF